MPEDTRAPASKRNSMGDLGRLLRPVRGALLVIAATSAAAALVALVPYLIIAFVTARLLDGAPGARQSLVLSVVCVVLALILRQALYMGSLGSAHLVEAKLRRSLREQLLERIGRVPLGTVGSASSGRLRRLVIDDTAAIHTIVAHVVAEAAGTLAGMIASIVILFSSGWQLALGYLLLFALVAIAAKLVTPRVGTGTQAEYARAQSELASTAVELAEGIAELKSYGLTGGFMDHFRGTLDHYSRASYAGTAAVARPMGVITSIVMPGVLLGPMVLLCAISGLLGWASPFAMIVFLLVGIGVPQTFFGTLSLVQNTQLGAAAARRITGFLDEPLLAEPTAPSPFSATEAHADIVFDRVSFGYGDDREVLREVTFTIPAGRRVALVGPSGSGKSTLTRLLARFWECSSGTIRIGDRDVREIRSEDLLLQIGFVFQDMMLASVSVRDNIRLARPGATDTEVTVAAKRACVHDRIMRLPNGYDTVVGSREAQLSGGEQQRLCIARVFLQDPPILILDEPTSFMDRDTERLLRDAFAEFFSGRTVLTIAHRLSTITDSDAIILLDDGRVLEQGTHEELTSAQGAYARLWAARTVAGAKR